MDWACSVPNERFFFHQANENFLLLQSCFGSVWPRVTGSPFLCYSYCKVMITVLLTPRKTLRLEVSGNDHVLRGWEMVMMTMVSQDQRVNGWHVCGCSMGDMQLACGWHVEAALVVCRWSVVTCSCVLVCGLACGKLGGVKLSHKWWPGSVCSYWLVCSGLGVCNDLSDSPSPVSPLPAADCISYISRFLSHQEFIIIPKYSMGI